MDTLQGGRCGFGAGSNGALGCGCKLFDSRICLRHFVLKWRRQLCFHLVFALQLVLSITIKNQVIPLCIGLAGSFAALLLMFLPSNLARLLFGPYGFFGALSFIYMSDWNPDTRVFTFIRTPTPWDNYAVLLAWVTATYVLGRILLKRKEL